MVISKTNDFNEEDKKIALLAKALSHPVRVEILKILSRKNACQCGQLVELP